MQKWFSGLVTSTFFKYMLAGLAAYLAAKLGIDKGTVEGFASSAVTILMALWGMWEASKDKVVSNGKRVPLDELPAQTKAVVKQVVTAAPSKNIFDKLFNR